MVLLSQKEYSPYKNPNYWKIFEQVATSDTTDEFRKNAGVIVRAIRMTTCPARST